MTLKVGKRDLAPLIEVLDGDHETVEAAAQAVWDVAEQIFASRAKFVVVGQLVQSPEFGRLGPDHPEAVKVGLGWYSTEGDARTASEQLWTNTTSGDQFATWVLDTFHGTPADWHKVRREKYAELEAKREEAARERQRKSIEDRARDQAKRAAEFTWHCSCSHERGEHSSDKPNRCVRFQCTCETYRPIKETT